METTAKQQTGEKVIRILVFTLVISVMSATMFNIVLPQIGAEFRLTLAQVSWVSSVYMLIYAIGSVTYGKLADKYKLKNLLTFGLIFFAIGSLIGLAAQTYWMVLLGRILQAAGASVVPATAMIIPIRYFPPETRGRAMGIVAAGLALGGALGPTTSALIVSVVHWRWLFLLPILALLTLPFYRKYLDDEPGKAGKIDWLGGGLLAITVALVLLSVTNEAWLLAGCALLTLGLFIVRIRSAAEPFVQPGLFRNKSYSYGLAIAFIVNGVGYSLAFLSPQLLSLVNGLAPGLVGFSMVPAAIASALLGRTGGKLADDKGNPFLYFTASALLIGCFVLLSTFAGISPIAIAIFLILGNVGQTFMVVALSNTISRTLPKDQTGVGMGLLSLLNFISGALAAGLYSKMVDHGSSLQWNPANISLNHNAFVFSNIYMVLAILHLATLAFYFFQFGKVVRKSRVAEG